MIDKKPLLVNTHDACNMLGCQRTKLFQYLREGVLERRKLGRITVIPYESLKRFAEEIAA
ncbi:helix-turn-helix domain-containing protein [Novosphingobium sp. B1]|uniref:helix-turn-helix domain-containing protein n=1 Tax=Novosphingobium sp. B1 TaxID=1938756 RepID=UPI0009D834E0|nr:helix-turn-helix domain-containing protein [Novosphingobium sp. B1]SMC82701.1 hypothetical protein SAMN06272759_1086 [Novosphingobium sp. B1]